MYKNTNLTLKQEEIAKKYSEEYFKYAICTKPSDKPKAENALKNLYKILNRERIDQNITDLIKEDPEIIWVDSPIQGAILAAKKAYPDITDYNSTEFKEKVKQIANQCSYGQFDAFWICYYNFISNEVKFKDYDKVENLKTIVQNCGLFWTFNDCIVVSEKPIKISIDENKKLHSVNDMALKFKDGTGIYVSRGKKMNSLVECMIDSVYGKK